jgi:HlyD family secretion protein
MRLNPVNVQNVVTYNVVIDVANPEQTLKPGMTANLTIMIDERNNVLKVPNAALRFTPPRTDSSAGAGAQGQGQGRRRQQGGDTTAAGNAGGNNDQNKFAPASAPVLPGQVRVVWVLGQDGKPQRRRITVGLSDGSATEVVDGDLKEGEMVITGQQVSSTSRTTNSSTPPGFGGAPRGAGGGGPRR